MHSAMSLRHVRLDNVLMMEKSLFNLVPKNSWIPSNIHYTQRAQNELSTLQHQEVPKMGS